MADPLSVSASVAGLLSLASAVTQSCYGMYREVKNAPRTLNDVIEELGLLRQVLKDLKEIYEQRSEPLAPLETVLTEIHDCGKKLEEFERKLSSKFRNPRKLLSRFRWSFEGGEIKAFVSQLQNCRGIFESAKTNATLKLAMAIRTDVRSESLLQDIARRGISNSKPFL
jgi:Fungal N-terminal domain of STAND proteins